MRLTYPSALGAFVGLPALTLALLLGCASGTTEPEPVASPPASEPAAAPTPSAAPTIADVLAKLTRAGLPFSHPVTYDATTDPVHLLGRPGQYTASASFDLPDGDPTDTPGRIGRGGVIEIWPTAAGAAVRSKFIQDALAAGAGALGTEYDYLAGPVLLRITGHLTPTLAAHYGKALTTP